MESRTAPAWTCAQWIASKGEDQLYIHPDECIDCGACEPECPVTAIFPEEDVPANMTPFIEKNREIFNSDTPPGRPTR